MDKKIITTSENDGGVHKPLPQKPVPTRAYIARRTVTLPPPSSKRDRTLLARRSGPPPSTRQPQSPYDATSTTTAKASHSTRTTTISSAPSQPQPLPQYRNRSGNAAEIKTATITIATDAATSSHQLQILQHQHQRTSNKITTVVLKLSTYNSNHVHSCCYSTRDITAKTTLLPLFSPTTVTTRCDIFKDEKATPTPNQSSPPHNAPSPASPSPKIANASSTAKSSRLSHDTTTHPSLPSHTTKPYKLYGDYTMMQSPTKIRPDNMPLTFISTLDNTDLSSDDESAFPPPFSIKNSVFHDDDPSTFGDDEPPRPSIKIMKAPKLNFIMNVNIPRNNKNAVFDDDDPSTDNIGYTSPYYSNDENATYEDDDPPYSFYDQSKSIFDSLENTTFDDDDPPSSFYSDDSDDYQN